MNRKLFGASLLLGAATFSMTACAQEENRIAAAAPVIQELPSPSGAGSSEPNLTVDSDGTVYLSWQQETESGHELLFSRLSGDSWSEPRAVAKGSDWFINWADFPSLVALPGGGLAAHYLRRHDAGSTYEYDIEIVQSADGGTSWSEPVRPHRDSVPAEHGFVSLFPDPSGELGAVWLDGRTFDESFGGTREMQLRYATLSSSGELSREMLIDERICDCCPTSWAMTRSGPIVAYRDRSPEEVRDIGLARWVDGEWTTGLVHADGWEIAACPVNGPAVAASGDRVAVAWFTGANDAPRVQVAFSSNSGESFHEPLRVDEGDPLGRVDLVMLDDGGVMVSWLESGEGGTAELRVRFVEPDQLGETFSVARTSQARASGFPRMERSGDSVVFAWTEPGDVSAVRTARLTLRGLE